MRKIALLWALFISAQGFAQGTSDWHLEKMPVDLETDYALSALPPHLRDGATVYLTHLSLILTFSGEGGDASKSGTDKSIGVNLTSAKKKKKIPCT